MTDINPMLMDFVYVAQIVDGPDEKPTGKWGWLVADRDEVHALYQDYGQTTPKDGAYDLFQGIHSTQGDAMAAGVRYCHAKRGDLVKAAASEARRARM